MAPTRSYLNTKSKSAETNFFGALLAILALAAVLGFFAWITLLTWGEVFDIIQGW